MPVILLKFACPDQVGLLSRITAFLAGHGGNLLEVHQFTDAMSGWFFARLAIDGRSLRMELPALRQAFVPLATELEAEWTLENEEIRKRMVILVSKAGHCLAELLWRWRSGELPVDIPLVISNHDQFRGVVEREGIRFALVPVDPTEKRAAFDQIQLLLREVNAEVVILARYMQILPADICREFAGRIINIHHSFLPSFAGANPYRQAFERGVKLIGATCHYVTETLDDGPIIEQEVVRVEHFHTPEALLRLGQDCERLAMARGVRYHIHDRVLVHGNKTVVFRD